MRSTAVALAAFLAALSAPPASAQGTGSPTVAYYLTNQSTFQRGCFGACDCAIEPQRRVLGTFLLSPAGSDPLFTYFDVTDVLWIVGPPDDELRIVGSGTYRIGGEVALEQQLTLDLQVDGDPVQHFDSGLVQGGGGFPAIDVPISIAGAICFDVHIDVHARPTINLLVGRPGLAWNAVASAVGFDVVAGDVGLLRASGGDFAVATRTCLANDRGATSLAEPVDPPATGTAFWYLVRYVVPFGPGSYDDQPPSLVASRDPGIEASQGACP